MKTILKPVLLILFALGVVSCDSDEDTPNNPSDVNAAELQAMAQDGQWRITYFFDTDSEETSDFNGYVFTFGADGVVMASNGTTEISGTWSVSDSDDDPFDDSPDDSDDVDFNLFFSAPAEFAELTDDWDIIEYNASTIRLIDVSGGNGGTDYLTFEKN